LVSNVVLVKGKLSFKVFQVGIIAGRQIIQDRDLAACRDQRIDQVGSDKTGATGNQCIFEWQIHHHAFIVQRGNETDNCQIDYMILESLTFSPISSRV
jgi:hypothetical protein